MMKKPAIWFVMALVLSTLGIGCLRFRISDDKARQRFSAKGSRVEFADYKASDGTNLHYAHAGNPEGPLLFFIHGSPGAWNAFEQYLQDTAWSRRYHLVSIDRPGFGYSQFGKAMPLEQQASLLAEMVRTLKKHPIAIGIGHSLGGPIVAALTAADSSALQGMVILAGSFKPSSDLAGSARGLLYAPPFRWLAPGAFRPSNDELHWFRTSILRMPEVLGNITCPVVLMHGQEDRMVPYADALFAYQYLRRSASVQLVTFTTENHFIPWTRFADCRHQIDSLVNNLINTP